jgi:hypothetical protein
LIDPVTKPFFAARKLVALVVTTISGKQRRYTDGVLRKQRVAVAAGWISHATKTTPSVTRVSDLAEIRTAIATG